MDLPLALLGLLLGIGAVDWHWTCLLAVFPLGALILRYSRQRRRRLIVLAIAILSGFVRPWLFIPGAPGYHRLVGIVYRAEENYLLLATFKGNYYLRLAGGEVGDILEVSGRALPLAFRHYQESFDFAGFLKRQFCSYELEIAESKKVFSAWLRLNAYKKWCLSGLDSDVQTIAASLLFGDSLSDLIIFSRLESLNVFYYLSSSGLHFSFMLHLIERKIHGTAGQKRFYLISLLLQIVFWWITGFKFVFLRLLIGAALRVFLLRHKLFLSRLNQHALTAIASLLINPHYAGEMGFIYSFSVLFALDLLTPLLPRELGKSKLLLPLLIYAVLLPVNIYFNYGFNPLGAVSGWVLAPCGVALFVMSIPLLAGPWSAALLRFPLAGFLWFAERLTPPPLFVPTSQWPAWIVIGIYAASFVAVMLTSVRQFNWRRLVIAGILTVAVSSSLPAPFKRFEIHFIDVGQGDATLVRHGAKNYLFDTGGDASIDIASEALIPYFRRLKIYRIDAVFITHQDFDHVGALPSLQSYFPIGRVYYNDSETIKLGDFTVTNFNNYRQGQEANYDSAVYYFSLKDKRVLIMGDAPKAIERKIVADHSNLKVDILKVGHHGSDTSSDSKFLEAIKPQIAVISCGYRNRYHHPAPAVLANLRSLDINIRRTDIEGTIVIKA